MLLQYTSVVVVVAVVSFLPFFAAYSPLHEIECIGACAMPGRVIVMMMKRPARNRNARPKTSKPVSH